MAKNHPDLVYCRKQPGIAIGRLCEKCDGKCVICDSLVRPHVLVHICDECNYGSFEGRCEFYEKFPIYFIIYFAVGIVCGSPGISDAYYCVRNLFNFYHFICICFCFRGNAHCKKKMY